MKRHHLIFSGLLLAVFVAFALLRATDHPSKAPTGTCKFSSTSISAISNGLDRGESAHEIFSTLGFSALPQACKFVLNNWTETPGKKVRVSISGATPQQLSGNQIQALTPSETVNPARIQAALKANA
jgi:hypothetical protein